MPSSNLKGVLAAVAASAIWGFMPVYWKLLNDLPALEILAYRIVWSAVAMIALVFALRKTGQVRNGVRQALGRRKQICYITAGAACISLTWLTYIWAVINGRILEVSLGYYINPLLNVGMGIALLGERLSRPQALAVALTSLGVGYMTAEFGSLPLVSIALMLSYGSYGLCKKLTGIDAMSGMLLETLVTVPIALAYLLFINHNGTAAALTATSFILLAGSGLPTVIPLILFAYGANYLPLSILGPSQYISPTISLLLGVFLYGEPFRQTQAITFTLIWAGLFIFSLPPILAMRERKRLAKQLP